MTTYKISHPRNLKWIKRPNINKINKYIIVFSQHFFHRFMNHNNGNLALTSPIAVIQKTMDVSTISRIFKRS